MEKVDIKKTKTLIIIPSYNEKESIINTVTSVKEYISNTQYNVDYIVVDDGSNDGTLDILKSNNIPFLSHLTNAGLGTSIKTGIIFALNNKFNYATQFDADGQHVAKYIDSLIETAHKGSDLVIGSRFIDAKKHLSLRMMGSGLLSFLILAKFCFKIRITDPTSGQRIFNETLMLEYLKIPSSPEPSFIARALKRGFKVTEIPVQMKERELGNSYFDLTNSVLYMIEQIITIIFV